MICPRKDSCPDYRINNVCCDQCSEFCTQSGVKIINNTKEFEVAVDKIGMPCIIPSGQPEKENILKGGNNK